jgi:hypothetical protein
MMDSNCKDALIYMEFRVARCAKLRSMRLIAPLESATRPNTGVAVLFSSKPALATLAGASPMEE